MPHVRTSLQINFRARGALLAGGGVFDQVSTSTVSDTQTAVAVPDGLLPAGHQLRSGGSGGSAVPGLAEGFVPVSVCP